MGVGVLLYALLHLFISVDLWFMENSIFRRSTSDTLAFGMHNSVHMHFIVIIRHVQIRANIILKF